ncbi:MAG: nickel pincer cofactor biosynthesis protein LarC [Chloroflexi bacterium]|nr:nickel pincer cofactor biosynthesis protein LarC [Chloroflexota bacterium]
MVLGALVDAGASLTLLQEAVKALGLERVGLKAEKAVRGGIGGTRVTVEVGAGRGGPYTWDQFQELVGKSPLPEPVKQRSSRILQRLARAESVAHGSELGKGTLHELGSPDTLVDVVGAAAGFHELKVERVFCAPLPVGRGTVATGHGILPVPVPATLELLREAGAVTASPEQDAPGEMVTPTGAAILTTLAEFRRPAMRLEQVGWGLGFREWKDVPNVLALWLGEQVDEEAVATLVLLETNIDDMTPQILGYVQERLLAHGALDAWFTSIGMKKNRPAVLLSALAPAHLEAIMVELILRETTTLGVRSRPVFRHEAQRETVVVKTTLGEVPVKVKRVGGRVFGVTPEYDACRTIALSRRMPLQEVMRTVAREAAERISGS